MSLFLCLSGILWERYYQKGVIKSWGVGKKIKRWDAHKGRVSLEWGFTPSVHFDTHLEWNFLNVMEVLGGNGRNI